MTKEEVVGMFAFAAGKAGLMPEVIEFLMRGSVCLREGKGKTTISSKDTSITIMEDIDPMLEFCAEAILLIYAAVEDVLFEHILTGGGVLSFDTGTLATCREEKGDVVKKNAPSRMALLEAILLPMLEMSVDAAIMAHPEFRELMLKYKIEEGVLYPQRYNLRELLQNKEEGSGMVVVHIEKIPIGLIMDEENVIRLSKDLNQSISLVQRVPPHIQEKIDKWIEDMSGVTVVGVFSVEEEDTIMEVARALPVPYPIYMVLEVDPLECAILLCSPQKSADLMYGLVDKMPIAQVLGTVSFGSIQGVDMFVDTIEKVRKLSMYPGESELNAYPN